MKSFLEHIAEELLEKFGTDLSRIAVVFPNKRASLFLNEHLARLAGKPLWSPAYITISDLFRSLSPLKVADPILLVCELHRCFTECTGIDETLDHFYGWGQLLLADFDDVDKNMAPADKVFALLRDIHELDDVSYLTDEQREIIRRFFSNFSDDHNTELKERFLKLWSHIGDIYHLFNRKLADRQLAYEGALYRQVATDKTLQFEYDTYVFIGFNLLHPVEQELFRRLEREGKALFYQDTEDIPPRSTTFISAPTENSQARYISRWLSEKNRIAAGHRTAIVLCDESLLLPVVHSLPDTVEKANITTGYPLYQTPIASLISQLISLQTIGYSPKAGSYRLRHINAVLRHPYAKYISPRYQDLVQELNAKRMYYPEIGFLSSDEGLALLFQHHDTPILKWLLSLVRHIATSYRQTEAEGPLDTESLFRMHTLLNRINGLVVSGELSVDVITLQRLIMQLIQTTTIPFHGEPIEGIQIMGVLETRNLDFDHVLLLSCNEGNMPRGINDTSFIPYSIRKAYGLTTVDNKVAIYANYFHHLLQRASDVTLVYNNSTNDGQTGEMSRFMLQLMVDGRQTITYQTLKAGQQSSLRMPKPIEKTEAVMEILRQRFLQNTGIVSPTAISNYLRCQLRFFYRYVSNLAEPDNNDEDLIDNRIFGNIFHLSAQKVYEYLMQLTGDHITALAIDDLLKNNIEIERIVDNAFKRELFQIKDPSRRLPPLDGLQLINREVIIRYIRQLLETDKRLTPFTILGLEKEISMPLAIRVNDHTADAQDTHETILKIGGYIDRLDSVVDPETGEERIRVIDYKTGAYHIKPLADVDAIFDPENIKEHSDYFLQAFLYSHIIRRETDTAVSPALLFIQHAGTDDYDPTLKLGKERVRDIATEAPRFMKLLNETISDIFNADITFMPTNDMKRCHTCPYATLCGR
ncbi:PD-(D/E)XK nuclease superfamily protein [Prevotella aff. ruminicola Tc2-24]|uniref:PD-(D/E)XK nuclease superfamily protein n=1 Tax=Prevotella aff. ruminicola Tc2-24 TaxID=81582 RepID=A0A1I0MAM4_9BACT|nr:PD-(D/E)XK nuclease family protein [Prevotella aff. ruminicola Tc2-24]SEV85565.1 PD-(D/E)XK nuclease superfamily protein [Prevotella aff. ruminicola Tc2-24]